tara:strand:+ start:883 stop:2472 length:1590 start_codon:yes stop_codon:yes gene_type:complete
MKYQNIIIGSGPTGIVAAEEMLNLGKEVAILDYGNTIEKKNQKIKQDFLNDNDKSKFTKDIQKNKVVTKRYKNENLKFPFGSDYVFRENKFEKFKSQKNIDFLYSNAKGGLSNIWGTMYSPFYPNDIKSWDISYEEFYKNGKEIENSIPLLSGKDNLDNFFPINFGVNHSYPLSSNAKDFFDKLEFEREEKNHNGIYFGRAKMAIGKKYSHKNTECKSCGLCHQGCPYDCMFSSVQLLEKIKSDKNLSYIKNIYVDKINKTHELIELQTIDTLTNEKKVFYSKNVFICCGPISTATLMLRSNMVKGNKIILKESQRFFIPIFKKINKKKSIDQNKNTLSEIFLEISNDKICDKSIHLQYYTFLNEMLKPLTKLFGKFAYLLPKFFPFIFGRLNLLIGYLHSDYSNGIIIEKNKDQNIFEMKELINNNTDSVIEKTINFTKKNLEKHFYIFDFLLNKNLTGASYHYGGSFPMSIQDKDNNTSLIGELYNHKNIFILDSSILPNVPASPTTVNVCINSKRIVKEINKLGRL